MGFIGFNPVLACLVTLCVLCSGEFYNNRPWPAYSLENMPTTGFSCRDKILGGYYADAETQCQMFHVCVKVAGVGIQDFRFLCPNSTAFDQEAQICADWGDVDCEASTLYYGSDNFDLYRIGSGFDSKRAPYADEEEATFHLQRAETGDARRTKQVIVDQNTKAEKSNLLNANAYNTASLSVQNNHNRYQNVKQTTSAPTTKLQSTIKSYETINNNNNNNNNNNYYNVQTQPTTSSQSPVTKVITTEQPYKNVNNDYFKVTQKQQQNYYNTQNNDEIFRGAQSSHFYNNRNNGKDDYEEDFSNQKTSTTKRPVTRNRGRGRGSIRANNANAIFDSSSSKTTTTTSTTSAPSYDVPKIRNPPQYNRNYNTNSYNDQPQGSTTTTTTTSPENFYDAYNTALKLQLQQQIAVQNYKNFPPSTTISPDDILLKLQSNIDNVEPNETYKIKTNSDSTFNFRKTLTVTTSTTTEAPKTPLVNSYNINYNNLNRNSQSELNQPTSFTPTTPNVFSLYSQSVSNADRNKPSAPRGFSFQQSEPEINNNQYQTSTNVYVEKYQTVNRRNNNENHTPASALKKYSTLVPKDQYNPTTFKPNTYKKNIENIPQKKAEKVLAPRFDPQSYFQSTTSSTTSTTTIRPTVNIDEIDEDDGQYHPELYEKDFVKNKLKQKLLNQQQKDYYQSQPAVDRQNNYQTEQKNNNYNYNNNNNNYNIISTTSSSEDEFLKTAHSQNIAASGNALKIEQLNKQIAEKNSYNNNNNKYVHNDVPKVFSNAPTISPNAKTTKKPVKKEKDASYDYAYYDSGNSRDYSEYDIIEEFGRTNSRKSN